MRAKTKGVLSFLSVRERTRERRLAQASPDESDQKEAEDEKEADLPVKD